MSPTESLFLPALDPRLRGDERGRDRHVSSFSQAVIAPSVARPSNFISLT